MRPARIGHLQAPKPQTNPANIEVAHVRMRTICVCISHATYLWGRELMFASRAFARHVAASQVWGVIMPQA